MRIQNLKDGTHPPSVWFLQMRGLEDFCREGINKLNLSCDQSQSSEYFLCLYIKFSTTPPLALSAADLLLFKADMPIVCV